MRRPKRTASRSVCRSKVRYGYRVNAERALLRLPLNREQAVYWCCHCRGYHLTSRVVK